VVWRFINKQVFPLRSTLIGAVDCNDIRTSNPWHGKDLDSVACSKCFEYSGSPTMSWLDAFVARLVVLMLRMTMGVFSQNSSAPSSPSAFMKVCSRENPPPCATAPRPLRPLLPGYSKEARQQNIEGTVVLSVIVRVDGHVQDIHVVSSLGHGLDEQAIKCLRSSTFEPGTSGGVPLPVLIRMEMDFHIR
jgi:TonB family protein